MFRLTKIYSVIKLETSKIQLLKSYRRDSAKMDILNELRLDSERTITVMTQMGVDPEIDLKVLHYKDFISAGLTPQIVKMRYQAYVDRITETAYEIVMRRDRLIS